MTPAGFPRFLPTMSLGLFLVVGGPACLWAKDKDIVIGMSAAFKGPSRGLGIELYRGSMAYFEHVNRTGGIGGRKIVIKAYNDGYNPTPAISNTIRLIEKDKVFLLYGYVGTPTVTRILPLLKRYSRDSVYLFSPLRGPSPSAGRLTTNMSSTSALPTRKRRRGWSSTSSRSAEKRLPSSTKSMPMDEAAGTASARPWLRKACPLPAKPPTSAVRVTRRASAGRWISCARGTRMR
jgi:hypothetical protein